VPTNCRKTGRRGRSATDRFNERFDVELQGDAVLVRCNGRVVRTLKGHEADAVRDVLHDDERLQRLLGREGNRS
jgi:hypothetical protein